MDDKPVLSSRIREAREYLGVPVAEIARVLGWEPAALERIEAGSTKITGEQLRRLSRLYRRPVTWFTGEFRFEPGADLLRQVEGLSERDRGEILEFAEYLQCAAQVSAHD